MIFEKIEDANSYPCLSITLATLAKYYGRDYHMISGSDWKLQYDVSTSSKRIGEQIDIISEVNIKDRTMKFHGFTWEIEPFGISYINKDTG